MKPGGNSGLGTGVSLSWVTRGPATFPCPVIPSVSHSVPSLLPWPGPAHTAQRVLPEPRHHLHVPACSECSVNILLLLLLPRGLWPGLEQSGDAPCVQTAAWSHPRVRGEPGLRGEHTLWSPLLLPGSHGGTGSLLQGSGPNDCAILPAVCHPKAPTSHELWQTHIPVGFKFPNNFLLHPGVNQG